MAEVPSVNPKLDAMGEMLKSMHNLNERNEALEKQLAKTKEYIKLLLMDPVSVYEHTGKTIPRIQAEAKQFLKETD